MARSKTRTSRRSVRAARRPARLIQEEDPQPLMEEVEEPLVQEPVVEQDDDEDAEDVQNSSILALARSIIPVCQLMFLDCIQGNRSIVLKYVDRLLRIAWTNPEDPLWIVPRN